MIVSLADEDFLSPLPLVLSRTGSPKPTFDGLHSAPFEAFLDLPSSISYKVWSCYIEVFHGIKVKVTTYFVKILQGNTSSCFPWVPQTIIGKKWKIFTLSFAIIVHLFINTKFGNSFMPKWSTTQTMLLLENWVSTSPS